jgi:hypothetical protein
LKSKSIAQRLKINIKTVHKWIKREHISDLPHRGQRAFKLTHSVKTKIESLCKDQWNASIRKTTSILNHSDDFIQNGLSISATTVGDFIRSTEWGKMAYRVKTAPMLTDKNIQDRLAFARMVIDEGYCENSDRANFLLDHLMFTDESLVELWPHPNAQNTRIRTSDTSLRNSIHIPKN